MTTIPEKASGISHTGKWLALSAALLGWLFDGAEMGLFSMVGRPAILNLLVDSGLSIEEANKQVGKLFGLIIAGFLVGAATGGVLFGWLGDRIGRVRAMSLSVLTYALFTGWCGLASSPTEIAILRFIAALGMGGEWSLGVALVMEIWPNKSRGLMAGLIGAAANVGYLIVGIVGMVLNSILANIQQFLPTIGFSDSWTEYLTAYSGWRIMMLLGTLPAALTFIIRIFVPESEKWEEEKDRGTTGFWKTRDLIGVLIGATGPFLIIMVWSQDFSWPIRILGTLIGLSVATAGYLYPLVQYMKRLQAPGDHAASTDSIAKVVKYMMLGAGLSGIALLGTWGSTQWVPTWSGQLVADGRVAPEAQGIASMAKEWAQISIAVGAIVGTLIAALFGGWFGRRKTYFGFCVAAMVSVIWLFQGHREFGYSLLFSAFVAGVMTASFYGWLPLYLPELFRTKFRATGQGFAFNFGRILAAIGTLQAGLLTQIPGQTIFGRYFEGGYPLACTAISMIYLVGMILIWTMPETKGKALPE